MTDRINQRSRKETAEQKPGQEKDRLSVSQETVLVAWVCLMIALVALAYCFRHGLLLLYGDAVAHLYIARRILDSRNPGFRQLGSVWLPLPHILLLPFVQVSGWWRNGLAGAWVSVPSYVLGCAGIYRLARLWLSVPAAIVALAFYALNPGLLYLTTTAMTEPLFLAEMIWAILLILCFERLVRVSANLAPDEKQLRFARRTLVYAGLVLVCAIFTRYDGWVLAAAAWIYVTAVWISSGRWRNSTKIAWIAFTVLIAAAPAVWILYNAAIFGDPLDFLRGPYSARAIEAATASPGSPGHPGSHSMHVAALYFLKAAEMGATPARYGNLLFWIAVAGTLAAVLRFRRAQIWPALLFWLPLPFYAYAIAYGSVPVFIPIWWPFSWYNTRYGMELLPAFALFGAFIIAALFSLAPKFARWAAIAVVALIFLNSIVLLRAEPLVFQEAVANSRTRISFERALANSLVSLPSQGTILMCTSKAIGAVQETDIPLRRIVSEGDNVEWQKALDDPARAAQFVVALDRDAVSQAVHRHPEGLHLLEVVCSTGQPCARVYRSER